MMSLTVVLGFFFIFLTVFCHQLLMLFLCLPDRHLLLTTPVVSFFFRTFQMVVLAMANVCAMALMEFPSSLSFKIACFFFP